MGLFFKKETCCICKLTEGSQKISDGFVCKNCLKACGGFYPSTKPLKLATKLDIENIIKFSNNNKKLLEEFEATKKIGSYIEIDENKKQLIIPDGFMGKKINPRVYNFEDIIDYELLEDGESITKGGLGRAVVGGALLGGVGAIVGGVTGKKKTKNLINSLKIKVTVNDTNSPTTYINLINTQTKASSFVYKVAYSSAQEILSIFAVITQSKPQQEGSSNISTADELLKLKQLLDEGILSKEEFDVEKNKILNR